MLVGGHRYINDSIAPVTRGRFMSPLELLILGIAISGLLFLLFPGADFDNPRHLARPDELSIAYLRLLLRAHPRDSGARLLLAQEQMALGHAAEARESLEPLLDRMDEIGARAKLARLELDRARMSELPPADSRRRLVQAEVMNGIRLVAPAIQQADDLKELAELALSVEDPAEAANIYVRLAEVDRDHALSWLESACRWYDASGDYQGSARGHLRASELASTPAGKRDQAIRALRALEAGQLGASALKTATILVGRFPGDALVLDQATRIALANHDLAHARAWGERQLASANVEDGTISRQVDIDLQAGDPEASFHLLRTLIARRPGHPHLWRRYAQVASWAGHPDEALNGWTWLARHGSEEGYEKALALARVLSDPDRVIELLELRARRAAPLRGSAQKAIRSRQPHLPGSAVDRRRPRIWSHRWSSCRTHMGRRAARHLSSSPPSATRKGRRPFELGELLLLVQALEDKGEPLRAIAVLNQFRRAFADQPDYWTPFSAIYQRVGDLEHALACAEEVTKIRGLHLTDALSQATLLWRLRRPSEALAKLVAVQSQARDEDIELWEMMGELAWNYERDAVAMYAYASLWRTRKTAKVAERLSSLYRTAGRLDDAVTIAQERFVQTKDVELFLTALEIATEGERWDRLRSLLGLVTGKEAGLAETEQFWLSRGMLATHDDKPREAEASFVRALTVNPRSLDASRERLSAAVKAKDPAAAKRALAAMNSDGADSPALWDELADAYALIGDERKAEKFNQLARQAGRSRSTAKNDGATTHSSMEDVLLASIDRHDRSTIKTILKAHGSELPLASRIAGERELGHDEDAWALLVGSGVNARPAPGRSDGSQLSEHFRDLRDEHLGGTWGGAGTETLGSVAIWLLRARLDLRARAWSCGVEAERNKMFVGTNSKLLAFGDQEVRAGGLVGYHESFGTTVFRGGAQKLPTGTLPWATLAQEANPWSHVQARAVAVYNELPSNTALIRAAGLRQGAEIEASAEFLYHEEIVVSASANRYATRSQELLGQGLTGRAEVAQKILLGGASLRLRGDVFADNTVPVKVVPTSIKSFLQRGALLADYMPIAYRTVGGGITFTSSEHDIGEGIGSPRTAHLLLDAWVGRLWPAKKLTYAFETGLGVLLTRYQELSASGFYYTDRGGEAGQKFAGVTVKYTLRWL